MGASAPRGGDAKTGLAVLGIPSLAVVCCAGGPVVAGAVSSIALGPFLGVGAGVAACVVVVAAVLLRACRRRPCEPVPSGEGPAT